MPEEKPLITLADIGADQTITNGRKTTYNDELYQDPDNLCLDVKQGDCLDGDPASDNSFYDDSQGSLDVYDDDAEDNDEITHLANELNDDDRDLVDDPSDEDDGSDDDDEYGYIIEEDD